MVEILAGINQGNADAGIFTSPTTLKAQHAGLKELVNVTEQNIPMIHAASCQHQGICQNAPRQRAAVFTSLSRRHQDLPHRSPTTPSKSSASIPRPPMRPTWRIPIRLSCRHGNDYRWCRPRRCRRCSISPRHPGAKTAKPETFIDNSILIEIGKSGFVDKLYK